MLRRHRWFPPTKEGLDSGRQRTAKAKGSLEHFFLQGHPMGLPEHTATSLAAEEKVKLHRNHSPTRSIGRNLWLKLCYSNNNNNNNDNNNIVFLVSLLSIGSWNYLNISVYSVYTSGSTIAFVSTRFFTPSHLHLHGHRRMKATNGGWFTWEFSVEAEGGWWQFVGRWWFKLLGIDCHCHKVSRLFWASKKHPWSEGAFLQCLFLISRIMFLFQVCASQSSKPDF